MRGTGRISIHVQHAFSIRLADLGFSRRWLFHLWQKAEILGADGRRTGDDRRVVFRRVCPVDVADRHRVDGSNLRAPETRLLTAEGTMPAKRALHRRDERLSYPLTGGASSPALPLLRRMDFLLRIFAL